MLCLHVLMQKKSCQYSNLYSCSSGSLCSSRSFCLCIGPIFAVLFVLQYKSLGGKTSQGGGRRNHEQEEEEEDDDDEEKEPWGRAWCREGVREPGEEEEPGGGRMGGN